MTTRDVGIQAFATLFQYRKRYEVTCDQNSLKKKRLDMLRFQYRKRYEVTCDCKRLYSEYKEVRSFNTASGMRSHVTLEVEDVHSYLANGFQYRKRYEVTCD